MGARGYKPKHAGMTPPQCEGPACTNPVKRHYGVRLDVAPRVVDGVAWRRFCSRPCSAANALRGAIAKGPDAGVAAWRLKNFRARVQSAKKELGAKVDDSGRLSVEDAVRFVMERERASYTRGYNACYAKARRGTLRILARTA